jgi:COX assembly mitochondrial protein 2
MHPPLDRPHPDCEGIVQSLKACHSDSWKKFTGGCNEIKVEMDHCFKLEKKRLLDEMNKDLAERKNRHEEVIKQAFGKSMTFSEYLKQDKEFRDAEALKRN